MTKTVIERIIDMFRKFKKSNTFDYFRHKQNLKIIEKKAKENISSDKKLFLDKFIKVIDSLIEVIIPNYTACLCTSENGGMAAMIFSMCLIDSFAGYYAGNTKDNGVGKRFDEFVIKYMKKYNCKTTTAQNIDLYLAVRCKLLHNFSEGYKKTTESTMETTKTILFCNGQCPVDEQGLEGDRRTIYVSTFVEDMFIAIEKYLDDVIDNSELQDKFKEHHMEYGFICEKNSEEKKDLSSTKKTLDNCPPSGSFK